jgi:hypothetical protein
MTARKREQNSRFAAHNGPKMRLKTDTLGMFDNTNLWNGPSEQMICITSRLLS